MTLQRPVPGLVLLIVALLASLGLAASPARAEAPAFTPECPPTLKCVVVPAAYVANDGDVENYGNYDITNRPSDMSIDKIVIHDTEGSLQDTLDHFRDPHAYVSTQYVIDRDGTIYQMVRNKDMTWHANNWWFNMHSIGIEHVGYGAENSYTPAMYKASAQLVKYLTSKYGIPRDRGHIVGHDNVPASRTSDIARMNVDPGPFWNWQNYMALIEAPVLPSGGLNSGFVTVAPVWSLNQQTVTGCTSGSSSCVPSGPHPTNFVYVRTEPRSDAPLITDPVTGQGSTEIANNSARLFHGQTFAVSARKVTATSIWYQVYVNGQKGWFNSPYTAPTAFPASGKHIMPKTGVTSIPVYGRPIPERSEYPAELLASSPGSWYIPTQTPLPYAVQSGQRYHVVDTTVPTDHFYAWASDSSFPYDHTVFRGDTRYYEIQLGNRTGFVKAEDVVLS